MAVHHRSSGIRRRELTGSTCGKLTVLRFSHSDKNNASWVCLCDCGTETIVSAATLTRKDRPNMSCGCSNATLGGLTMTHKAEYHAWHNMIRRCHDATCEAFSDYGARGISVCQPWRESFPAFLSDVGPRPSRLHSLERENNEDGYHPDNCLWATKAEQMRNTRSNHWLTLNGRTLCITDWAKETGIAVTTITARLRYGWTADRALTTPVGRRNTGIHK